MLAHAFRRLYLTVTQGQLFDEAVDAGSVFLTADVGGTKAESEAQRSAASMAWNWQCELEPSATCTHCVLAVHRRRFMGTEVMGQALVPLSSLQDQHAHILTVTLSPPASPHNTIGEATATFLYADYQQLRRAMVGDAEPRGSSQQRSRDLGWASGSIIELTAANGNLIRSSGSSSSVGSVGRPPPALPVPARFASAEHSSAAPISATHTSSTSLVASTATSPDAHAGGRSRGVLPSPDVHLVRGHSGGSEGSEVGFLYDRGQLRRELDLERAELMRCKTEAAGARFARHILRAMVSRLVEKRRALQSEVRHMESERAMLTVQLQLLLGQAASAGSTEDAATAAARNAETASLVLLDEAEARHAKVLAERRRAHLSVVGSLQREYIQALHTIKDEGFGPEGASPPGTRLELMMITPGAATGTETPSATGASEAYEGGTRHAHCSTAATFTPGFTPGETAHRGTPGAAAYGLETHSMLVPAAAFAADEVQTRQSRMQKEIFMLEQQLQRLKDQVLDGDNALATAEGAQLQLRGLAAAAEEAKAEAEARRDEAETRAKLATEERDAARREVAELRATIADAGGAERRWLEERNELRA